MLRFFFIFLLFTLPISAQQKVTAETVSGDSISGVFVSGDTTSITLDVSGNKVKIKLSDLVVLKFKESASSQTTTLSLEAGLIYNVGGVQPVARTQFFLLDASAETILDNDEFKKALREDASRRRMPIFERGAIANYVSAIKYPTLYPTASALGSKLINERVIQTITTDFNGKAQVDVKTPGNYYLFGYTGTRKGWAAWNIALHLKPGDNSITLDQNNAVIAF